MGAGTWVAVCSVCAVYAALLGQLFSVCTLHRWACKGRVLSSAPTVAADGDAKGKQGFWPSPCTAWQATYKHDYEEKCLMLMPERVLRGRVGWWLCEFCFSAELAGKGAPVLMASGDDVGSRCALVRRRTTLLAK